MLKEHPWEIESDLQRYYSIDIASYYTGDLSLRRLSVLLIQLPPEAALVRALSGSQPGWDLHAYLLADLFQGITGQVHPSRPKGKKSVSDIKERTRRLQEQQARLAHRRQAASE